MIKIDIAELIMSFPHEISADKIILFRQHESRGVLLKQIEDKINEQIEEQERARMHPAQT